MTNNIVSPTTPEIQFLIRYGDLGSKLLYRFDDNAEEAQNAIDNCYKGVFLTKVQFARNLFKEECKLNKGVIPDYLEMFKNNMSGLTKFIFDGGMYYAFTKGMYIQVFSED